MLRTALLAGTVVAALGAGTAVPAVAQPSDPDSLFWQSVDPARPDEVQAYLHAFPDGHFKVQATAALAHDPATPEAAPSRLDVAAWQAIDPKSPSALQSYLLAFPNGLFAPLARARLAESLAGLPLALQPQAAAPPPVAAAAPAPKAAAPAASSSAAAPSPTVAAPQSGPQTEPAAAPVPPAVPPAPPVMEVVRTAILHAAPSVRSRALHEFAPGERLTVGPIVPDGHWYRFDSGKWHGYVAASVLKAVTPPASPVPPVPGVKPSADGAAAAGSGTAGGGADGAGVIAGSVQVIDTGDLMVGGHKLVLFGIQGLGAPYDAGMAAFLAKQGGTATCRAKGGGRYVCVTTAGVDLAEAALVNGAAKASPDAPTVYLNQQQDAKANKRGIWSR